MNRRRRMNSGKYFSVENGREVMLGKLKSG